MKRSPMLKNASDIKGHSIVASDGQIGTVSDFLFDDASWMVRWMVVDTGNWLTGRKVLLPPSVLRQDDSTLKEFSVTLTKQQVKDSPDIDTHRPVSRQMETGVYDYYGWSPYWGSDYYLGGYGYRVGYGYGGDGPLAVSPPSETRRREEYLADIQRDAGDPHLRSVAAVTGYHIGATDGEIGHVEDFLIGETDWSIRYLVADTKNWWPGKKVLISPWRAKEIEWTANLVHLNVDRETVKSSPEYDAAAGVDEEYEKRFHDYYGSVTGSDRHKSATRL